MSGLFIGPLNGTFGVYISRPDDDVHNPSKNLLLDTRYDALRVHAKGRTRLERGSYSGNPGGYRYFHTGIPFPALGYAPLYWGNVVYRSSNTIYHPPVDGELDVNDEIYIEYLCLRLIDNNSKIQVEFRERTGEDNPYDVDLLWTIYKNPETI